MQELYGVTVRRANQLTIDIKQQLLFFDRIFILGLGPFITDLSAANDPDCHALVHDIEYLSARDILRDVHPSMLFAVTDRYPEISLADHTSVPTGGAWNQWTTMQEDTCDGQPTTEQLKSLFGLLIPDVLSRLLAVQMTLTSSAPVIPILHFEYSDEQTGSQPRTPIFRIGLEMMPTPSEDCSIADILNFKEEMREKEWGFRRFLHDLAIKKRTEAEIRDDIEWSLNQYTNAMKLHNLKAGNDFVNVYVIPSIEVMESFVKFNWSKIAKGVLSVKERKVALMEAEANAKGREAAYIFDARKRFGAPSRI